VAQGSGCESGNRNRADGLFVPHGGSQRVFVNCAVHDALDPLGPL
jgi:hypothetical protein